jgi:hypothetical protein
MLYQGNNHGSKYKYTDKATNDHNFGVQVVSFGTEHGYAARQTE